MVAAFARGLVDHPEQVAVREADERGTRVVELSVADGDLGQVIGRGGRSARALRSLVRAAGTVRNERYSLDIVD
ncbi:MAG TPA: KH domain-containing protein, partial [Miltoncostaeaceae bacterium]|nr:KH domain-containing protein [Miltoncostaeaceae bacterium]